MLQIRDLEEIKNDPKKVEELLNDDEKELLHQYEERMKRACAEGANFITVTKIPAALYNLLKLNGYVIAFVGDGEYRIGWLWQETEKDEDDIEIYAIVTMDDEMHSSIKAYYSTEELAKKHEGDYTGWYNTAPQIRKIILHRK